MDCPSENIIVWNVRGLNAAARRNVVRDAVSSERASLVCLSETKLSVINDGTIMQMLGVDFDYVYLPAMQTRGGILLAWHRDIWAVSDVDIRLYSTARLQSAAVDSPWRLTTVYGLQEEDEKLAFLDELRNVSQSHQEPWAITGDFNMIYQAQDKSNANLDYRWMRRFRRCLDDLSLKEVDLHGRRFTWSNERANPTMVRLDRFFCTVPWDDLFLNCILQVASSSMSDHWPIVLSTNLATPKYHRFRFENFWVRMEGYLETVQAAWHPPANLQPLQRLDWLLSNTAKALQRWSQTLVGSVRSQLLMAKELVLQLDIAQESRALTPLEQWFRRDLKS